MKRLIPCILAAAFFFPGLIDVKDARRSLSGDNFDSKKYLIRDKPISFTEKRKKLTLDYIRRNYDPRAGVITIVPRMIVIHWTASATADDARSYFSRETLQPDRADIRRGGAVNVSAHYLVDRDGSIYRLMPDTWMGRHVIGLNHCAIGIENVGGPAYPLTNEQLESNAWLAVYLARRYPAIECIIGHHEYLGFRKGPLWRARDPKYRAYAKIDPGEKFMEALRVKMKEYLPDLM